MIRPDENGYFITGSDTDVGKTWIACEIVKQLRRKGFEVATRKPAESGCRESYSGELLTHDAAALQAANGNRETIDRITPYRYRAALAPPRAARLENQRIELQALVEACGRDHPAQCLVVEGAGGFYSPLAENGLNADLASALQLPVIVVVDDRIGAVNQALMTLQAVASRHLSVAAIVLNQVQANTHSDMDNAADLQAHSSDPVFRCGYQGTLVPIFEGSDDPG
ncbi:MAG: dethiobiotin synthase [Gammaproteobacteria bacterium]|nr:dethiobiotin synthase [Gammaproteobacteria bacterium]